MTESDRGAQARTSGVPPAAAGDELEPSGALRQRRVKAPGAELAVREWGDPARPTVLLVHGYPDTAAVWDEVVQRLRERYRVVAYDVRGAGASSRPRGKDAYALERLAEDLAVVVDAVSPDAPVHLVGHDWGAMQGWEAIAGRRLEGRIASFTAIAGPSLDRVGHWMRERLRRPRPRALAQLTGQGLRSWYIAAYRLPGAGLSWRGAMSRLMPRVLRSEGVEPRPGHPAPTVARDGAAGVWMYRANVGRRLRRPRRFETSVPVQVICGTRDRYVSPALDEGLERWAPNLWRRRPRAGHWVQRSHPEQIARWIGELTDHVEGAPAARSLRLARVRERRSRERRRFEDRLVVVTGAGSGIGRATALAFVREGAEVVAADLRREAAEETAALGAEHGTVHVCEVDVSDGAAMEAFATEVEGLHGVPDVLVNNAGIGLAGPFLDTTEQQWRDVLGVNLWGVIHGARLFGAQMAERGEGGRIVNVASAAAYSPSRELPAYATTKAAVLMLSECLRAELGEAGIRVSAVCPGIIDTNITRTARWAGVSETEQERRRLATAKMYRRRGYGPERVAEAILRGLLTDAAVVPVTVEAKAARFLSRLSPAVMRSLARLRLAPR